MQKTNPKVLSYEESLAIISRYGIPTAKGEVAKSPQDAIRIAAKIGFPVALKIVSPQITHKTDAKAIKINISSDSELTKSYEEVVNNAKKYDPEAEIQGVLVQEMVKGGTETIVGVSRDQQFGPTILFGLGGIFVEVLKDFSLRVCPLSRYDAEEMVKEIKGYKVLEAFRDKPKSDIEGIVDALLKVSKLAVDLQESVLEMDINPLMVLAEGKGVKAVDVRIVALK